MNEEEMACLNELIKQFKDFKRKYIVLWAGVFITAILLRSVGLWG